MIEAVFEAAAGNTLLSLALALVAAAAGLAFRRPAVLHLLWLLVLVKLLTPPLVPLPVIPATWGAAPAAPEPAAQPPGAYRELSPGGAAAAAGPAVTAGGIARRAVTDIQHGLFWAWLLGSSVLGTLSLYRAWQFHRLLARESLPADRALQAAAETMAAAVGLAIVPKIRLTAANLSPLVWWAGGDVWVVIPSPVYERMDAGPFRSILAHELAHVRRRDYLVRWIEWLSGVCFWWNPVAWWARRNLRIHEELCCDAMVLSGMKLDPHVYGRSLLDAARILALPDRSLPAPATGFHGGRQLGRRVRAILSPGFGAPGPRRLHACVLAVAMAAIPAGLTVGKTGPDEGAADPWGAPEAPYIQKGACPFEGCAYGDWVAIEDMDVYGEPDTSSAVTGRIRFGDTVRARTGQVHVTPGRAFVTARPEHTPGIAVGREITILEYLGEGRSRVFQDGTFYVGVTIARTKDRCAENPDRRYCWAEILREPVERWWVEAESAGGIALGWVPARAPDFRRLDEFAPAREAVRCVIDDPDGYTNVRRAPNARSDILGRIRDGEVFIGFPVDGSAWWTVLTRTKRTGYMHASRIRRLEPGPPGGGPE